MSEKFDNWEYVECNSCANYHNDTCDGVPSGQERNCTAYKAVRGSDLPARIKALEKTVKLLLVALGLTTLWIVLSTGIMIVHWG